MLKVPTFKKKLKLLFINQFVTQFYVNADLILICYKYFVDKDVYLLDVYSFFGSCLLLSADS